MTRMIAVAAAAAATLALAPMAGTAQTTRGYYSAVSTIAPGKTNIITRSTVWKCNENVCTASKATSRDAIMCELVVREIGTLQSFTAGGTAFDAAALEKCNARAK